MTLARSLGVERAVILYVDAIGMCHGSNRGFRDLAAKGCITCASVMVPCPWFRQIAEAAAADPKNYDAAVAGLDREGLPVVDQIRGTLPVPSEAVAPGYRKVIEELPAGVTHFALPCTAPGKIEPISPQHARWRTNEYALFAWGAVAEWCAALGIVPVGYRSIQMLWTERVS